MSNPPVNSVATGPRKATRTVLWNCLFGFASLAALAFAGFHLLSPGLANQNRIEEGNGEIRCQMGDVLPGTHVRQTVPIWNRTNTALKISTLTKSCSCLDLTLSSETIQPGAKSELGVTLATPTYRCPFEHRVKVDYEGDAPPTLIRFSGSVGAWIHPSVPIIDFGEVCAGGTARQTVDFQVAQPWPRSQSEFSCTLPHARIEEITADKFGTAYHCKLSFNPPLTLEPSEINGDFVLLWTGKEGRRLNVQCRAKVTPEWTAEPPAVALGKVRRGQPVNFSVQLKHHRNDGDRALPQVSTESNADFKFQFNASKQVLTILGTILESGTTPPGLRRAMLIVKSTDGKEVLRIPVYWEFDAPKEGE